jgi:hypothetical protein
VLTDYGQTGLYPELLRLLGCAQLTRQRVEQHLLELTRTFDAAAAVAKTPFFFSTDITALTRPIAIDASQRLIDTGCHREAVFWIVATFARCQKILAADAPPRVQHAFAPAFRAVVADLGITSTDDIFCRVEEVTRFLPKLWETTETILSSSTSPQT